MRPLPSGGVADVWWFDAGAITLSEAELAYLDAAETKRANSLLFPADRHRYQVAHVRLREVLAGYLPVQPGQLPFCRQRCRTCGGPSGRPVLAATHNGAMPWFSLAHSGDMVVIAVAGRPVGVDVERDRSCCVCALAEVLHADDAAELAALAEADRHEAAIACWVRAEAVLKCTGEGIGHGLGEFAVWSTRAGTGIARGCTVHEMPSPPGCRAAIALCVTPGALASSGL